MQHIRREPRWSAATCGGFYRWQSHWANSFMAEHNVKNTVLLGLIRESWALSSDDVGEATYCTAQMQCRTQLLMQYFLSFWLFTHCESTEYSNNTCETKEPRKSLGITLNILYDLWLFWRRRRLKNMLFCLWRKTKDDLFTHPFGTFSEKTVAMTVKEAQCKKVCPNLWPSL